MPFSFRFFIGIKLIKFFLVSLKNKPHIQNVWNMIQKQMKTPNTEIHSLPPPLNIYYFKQHSESSRSHKIHFLKFMF